MVRFVLVGHIKVLDQRKNSMPLIYTRVVPGATWNDLRGHHDHGAIGNYITSDRPLPRRSGRSRGWCRMNVNQAAYRRRRRRPSKLPPMSAVSRPCSPSLIPQKLPKNGPKERHNGVSS
jgi:hypothetical protein